MKKPKQQNSSVLTVTISGNLRETPGRVLTVKIEIGLKFRGR